MTSSEISLFMFRVELCLFSPISCAYQLFVSTTRQFHNDFPRTKIVAELLIVPSIEFDTLSFRMLVVLNNSKPRENSAFFLCRCQGQRAVHRMSLSPLVISLKLGLFSLPSITNCKCNFMQLRAEQKLWFTSNERRRRNVLCLGKFSLFVSFMALLGARRCFETATNIKASILCPMKTLNIYKTKLEIQQKLLHMRTRWAFVSAPKFPRKSFWKLSSSNWKSSFKSR